MFCIIRRLIAAVILFKICGSVPNLQLDELSNQILIRFEKSLPNNYDIQILQAIQFLNVTLQKYSEFQSRSDDIESGDAILNSRIGIFIFTRFCGPGARFLNRILKKDERTYARIDSCCQKHDECPDYVTQPEDYKRYPQLDHRPQFFSRFV